MAEKERRTPEQQMHVDFVALFSVHQRNIKAYIRSLVPSAADADDVMQETSVILWEKFAEYERDRDFGRWGCGIARMVVLRVRRKSAIDKHWFNEEVIQLIASDRLNQQASAWELRREALRECIASLESRQQRFLDLRYAHNMSVSAVSRAAGKPVSTMYRHLAKIRKSLYQCVTRRLDEANRR